MKNTFKIILLSFFTIFLICITGCRKHECVESDWIYPKNVNCEEQYEIHKECTECKKILDTKTLTKDHELVENKKDSTCSEQGYIDVTCKNCNYHTHEDLRKRFICIWKFFMPNRQIIFISDRQMVRTSLTISTLCSMISRYILFLFADNATATALLGLLLICVENPCKLSARFCTS